MSRLPNIFYNVVNDEDSTTELLCNFMRFTAFRRAFLNLFLPNNLASEVMWDAVETQVDLSGFGRADVVIQNDVLTALIEVKTTYERDLTENQPSGYLAYLSRHTRNTAREPWLVFLVPGKWAHRAYLDEALQSAMNSHARDVKTKVITWEQVIAIVEDNGLHSLSPALNDFSELIASQIAPKPVVFTMKEVIMLFSNEIPTALSKLRKLVDDIQALSATYNVRPSNSKDEYGFYMYDAEGQKVFWFGLWLPFWQRHELPLSFGVAEKWPLTAREAFAKAYSGPTKQFDKYAAGSVPQECFASDNAVDAVWQRVQPIMDAIRAAILKANAARV
jgi:hypothetical protein